MSAKRILLRGAAIIILAAAGMAVARIMAQENAGSQAVEIKVTARKYKFDPDVITVKKGQQVKLVITAVDHDYGFELAAFNIDQTRKKGGPAATEFTPYQAGTYPLQCSVVIGLD